MTPSSSKPFAQLRNTLKILAVNTRFLLKLLLSLNLQNKIQEAMGVDYKFEKILESLKDQPPKMHDIKIMFHSKLHAQLLKRNYKTNVNNKSIKLKPIILENYVTCKLLVYPDTTQLDIACSYAPLVYDQEGVMHLLEHLKTVSNHLQSLSEVPIPDPMNWVITHYHFGKDGTESFNGEAFNYTVEDVACSLTRFYMKRMTDNLLYPRLEQIRTDKITIAELLQKVMNDS